MTFICFIAVLGGIDPGVGLDTLGPLHIGTIDKLLFSMVTQELIDILDARPHIQNVVIFGIEVILYFVFLEYLPSPNSTDRQAQICVLQTTLSLLSYSRPIKPYIIADGVSSSNAFEIPILFDRLRQEGAIVTTTQSFGYQIVGSATHPQFKAFAQYNKETGEAGNLAGKTLLGYFAPKV